MYYMNCVHAQGTDTAHAYILVLEYSVLFCLHAVQHLGLIYIAAMVKHQWVGLKSTPDVVNQDYIMHSFAYSEKVY